MITLLTMLSMVSIGQSNVVEEKVWTEPIDYGRAALLAELLFPNKSSPFHQFSRSLAFHPQPDTRVPCITCQNLAVCQSLNGFLIQEKYFPNNLELLGTCLVIEDLGKRIKREVFGNGKTFRDTSLCTNIVMQYLCLFWGSDNEMYTNLCIWQEDVTSPDPKQHKLAPRPPCRSFCIQVADICASDPGFIDLCTNIACPPTEDQCTPGYLEMILSFLLISRTYSTRFSITIQTLTLVAKLSPLVLVVLCHIRKTLIMLGLVYLSRLPLLFSSLCIY